MRGFDYLGLNLSRRLFLHWAGGSGDPIKLNWSDFDDDGNAANTMKNAWIFENLSTLKKLCKNASDGKSHRSGSVGREAIFAFQNTATPFISQWRAKAKNHHSGIIIDHDKSKCECDLEFGLDLRAYDTADFNPGESFGPGGIIPDDLLIWFGNRVPRAGAGFRIYALHYVKTSRTIGYRTLE